VIRRGAARAEDAQGTPTQSHVSPSILVYEGNTPKDSNFDTSLPGYPGRDVPRRVWSVFFRLEYHSTLGSSNKAEDEECGFGFLESCLSFVVRNTGLGFTVWGVGFQFEVLSSYTSILGDI